VVWVWCGHTTPTPHPVHHTNTTLFEKVVVWVHTTTFFKKCGVVWVWFGRRLSVVCHRKYERRKHRVAIVSIVSQPRKQFGAPAAVKARSASTKVAGIHILSLSGDTDLDCQYWL